MQDPDPHGSNGCRVVGTTELHLGWKYLKGFESGIGDCEFMPSSITGTAIPSSKHFRIHVVADGAYAGIAHPEGWAVGNAGIIDLGDHTIVFDTFASHLAAADLKGVADTITGRPVDYVLNSHAHRDQVKGNQVFADAAIVATRRTCELMTQNWMRPRRGRGRVV